MNIELINQFLIENKLYSPLVAFLAAFMAFMALFINQYFMNKRFEKDLKFKYDIQDKDLKFKKSMEEKEKKLIKIEHIFEQVQNYHVQLSKEFYASPYDEFDKKNNDKEELLLYFMKINKILDRLSQHRAKAELISKIYVPEVVNLFVKLPEYESCMGSLAISLKSKLEIYRDFNEIPPEDFKKFNNYIYEALSYVSKIQDGLVSVAKSLHDA